MTTIEAAQDRSEFAQCADSSRSRMRPLVGASDSCLLPAWPLMKLGVHLTESHSGVRGVAATAAPAAVR
jgi:hypothetical protein